MGRDSENYVVHDSCDDVETAKQLFADQVRTKVAHGEIVELFDSQEGKVIADYKTSGAFYLPASVSAPTRKILKLDAWQCGSCPLEFVVVSLSVKQAFDSAPYCPACGDDDQVHKIDCLDFTLVEKVQEYVIEKRVKPLPS